ncbi:MAG: 50S ribosomal protein L24 [Planctomycetota bacterium]
MATVKSRLCKNDIVQVIAGTSGGKRVLAEGEEEKLRGRRGKILRIDRERGRAIVEGVNFVHKHQRIQRDTTQPNTGRIRKEAPVPLSNLMLVCPKCDRPTRLAFRSEPKTDASGHTHTRKTRLCKKCGADIPERAR